ncbi:MAG: triose-phosphate isomerase [Nitrososphaerales archaeon]
MPKIRTPMLIINFKNYLEASGEGALRLAKVAEEVSQQTNTSIVVCPPLPYLSQICSATKIPVFAQHTDPEKVGSSTGAIVAEVIKVAGAKGSILNHSERRIEQDKIKATIKRLHESDLVSVVCAREPSEVSVYAEFSPDYIAIEPPELIGSGVAVSKAKPEVITESVKAAAISNPDVGVICGAGIVDGSDVEAALNLGVCGVLVASGIVKAADWRSKILEMSKALQ